MIAGAAVLRELFAPPRFPALRAAVFGCLGVSALVAVLAFYNLGRPQFWDGQTGEPTPVHLLGSAPVLPDGEVLRRARLSRHVPRRRGCLHGGHPGATLDNMRDTPMRDLSTHRMTTHR